MSGVNGNVPEQLSKGHGPPPCGENAKLSVAGAPGINPDAEILILSPGFTVEGVAESVSPVGACVAVAVGVGVGTRVGVGVGATVEVG